MNKQIGPVKNLKGILIRGIGMESFFRVYNEDHTFTDYEIHHYDLDVTIHDEGAFIYEREDGTRYIDYCPETYGIDNEVLSVYDDERLVSNFDKQLGFK
jgi:hypothetical protein